MKSFLRILLCVFNWFLWPLFVCCRLLPETLLSLTLRWRKMLKALATQAARGLGFSIELSSIFSFLLSFFLIVPILLVYRVLAPPTFGSSPNFEAITLGNKIVEDVDSAVNATLTTRCDFLLNFISLNPVLFIMFFCIFAAYYADRCMRSPSQPSTSLNSLVRLVVLCLTSLKFYHNILLLKLINFATILMLRYRLSCRWWLLLPFFWQFESEMVFCFSLLPCLVSLDWIFKRLMLSPLSMVFLWMSLLSMVGLRRYDFSFLKCYLLRIECL